ncbi:trimethylamine methyltransferase [Chromatiales bacterium (ex Bugula neritina AB1)]|nr:trimethylamine methyltransferase [Chromatiales bacterium (ex Bugula neritina AB1)]
MVENTANAASGKRRKRTRKGRKTTAPEQLASNRGCGGRYRPLKSASIESIHQAVLQILAEVGMAEATDDAISIVTGNGGRLSDNGRLCFPAELVARTLRGLKKNITLHGQQPGHELYLSDQQVHVGSGGAAPMVVDINTGQYRDATLVDLYDAARLVDALDNVHFFSRSLVARDMPDDLLLDINTAYASLTGTRKHVMVSASCGDNVAAIADLCFTIAGSRAAFMEKPFLSINVNHTVSPLRYSQDACDVLREAALAGIPVHINTFAQLGASSPVTIAACVAQTMAETLAGMIYSWLINPEVKAIFGPRPMVTDLRTGAMAGGAGEQALLTAASVQMARHYGLSNSTIAGATDSKINDAQSGYEKSLSVSLAAQTGCNMITQACGMQAGLMACSFESYVTDNDMLGTIMRTLSPIDTSGDILSVDSIANVVNGDGHYLGQTETLNRMQTDFLYPGIADRRNHEVWAEDGAPDIRTVANKRAKQLLESHFPSHISPQADKLIRDRYDIRLDKYRMQSS